MREGRIFHENLALVLYEFRLKIIVSFLQILNMLLIDAMLTMPA